MGKRAIDLRLAGLPRMKETTDRYIADIQMAMGRYELYIDHPDMKKEAPELVDEAKDMYLMGKGYATAKAMEMFGGLHWKTRAYSPEAMALAMNHDRLQHDMPWLIPAIDEIVPKANFNPRNPTYGNDLHQYEIGLEFSPVLYVHIFKMSNQGIHEVEWTRIELQLLHLSKEFNTDECSVIESNESILSVRYWYD